MAEFNSCPEVTYGARAHALLECRHSALSLHDIRDHGSSLKRDRKPQVNGLAAAGATVSQLSLHYS